MQSPPQGLADPEEMQVCSHNIHVCQRSPLAASQGPYEQLCSTLINMPMSALHSWWVQHTLHSFSALIFTTIIILLAEKSEHWHIVDRLPIIHPSSGSPGTFLSPYLTQGRPHTFQEEWRLWYTSAWPNGVCVQERKRSYLQHSINRWCAARTRPILPHSRDVSSAENRQIHLICSKGTLQCEYCLQHQRSL